MPHHIDLLSCLKSIVLIANKYSCYDSSYNDAMSYFEISNSLFEFEFNIIESRWVKLTKPLNENMQSNSVRW